MDAPSSLVASPSVEEALYPWQLYSLLGRRRIHKLIHSFYTRVFNDEEFRVAFANVASKRHHIQTQTAFWIDAMGGGRQYHGGDYRLHFHHTHNASSVMNAEGARRWMHHMTGAILE